MIVRIATQDDVASVNALTGRSIRALHSGAYDDATIETAIRHAYGVDWQLIIDRSYFVVEINGVVVGAGGWSFRKTIAGAHGPDDPAGDRLDPSRDAARIRAFYVDPAFIRNGIGTLLLRTSETAAHGMGFARVELTSTLPAVPFYAIHGYDYVQPYRHPLPDGSSLKLILMAKQLGERPSSGRDRTA
ncbi:GNAT family N-acetyltransferase [Sphingomonas nostoxanthinifaciens]|uniref:GNAT family N-acetyltransferase n=1 Tax=Sphingomonas nostoxanthinifaciens TaxID=2872652 RepID=UPI001CC1D72A|nr:GNAT family N-acetyltransferase [Sphingomonas nostoxanthinifaciens]UAK25611.1 GNAT family N-acetyltransferase [Sphingomonas nostoxanthinifaciens]